MYELSNYTSRVLQSRNAWYSHSLFKSRQACPSIPSMATCRYFLRKILFKRFFFFVSSRLLERHRRVFYNFWKMIWRLDQWRCSVVTILTRSRKKASVSSSWYMRECTFSYANKKSTAASAPILRNWQKLDRIISRQFVSNFDRIGQKCGKCLCVETIVFWSPFRKRGFSLQN